MVNVIDNNDQVVIVGAGIAGLSLAILLTAQKIPCIVVEARSDFAGTTTGVRISANGVRVLEKMGIQNIGEPTEKLIMHFNNNTVKFDNKNELGASPAIIVTRLAVFEKLRERIKDLAIPIVYNYKLENVIEDTDHVIAISDKGQQIRGKYLVGADGVGSKIRSLLNKGSNTEKRYAGYLGIGFIFPSDEKVEMSLFNNSNGNVGLGSIGQISSSSTYKNNFMWMHIHMPEQEARQITDQEVYKRITERSSSWPQYLQQVFQSCINTPKTILYHQPVYNGSIPNNWYSDHMFLIGDAAHPYGPGGQGISLAMLDAEALCELIANGVTATKKAEFQTTRGEIAKSKGESAEERNKPENQISSKLKLFLKWLLIKGFHLIRGGKMDL